MDGSTVNTASLSTLARKADGAYLNMSLAAIELNDARIFELPVEPAALRLLLKVQAAVNEIIPELERRLSTQPHAHLWVAPGGPTEAVHCQRCGSVG
jgi:hypothetical protein